MSKPIEVKSKDAEYVFNRGKGYIESVFEGELLKVQISSPDAAEDIGRRVMQAIADNDSGFFEDLAKMVKKRKRSELELNRLHAYDLYNHYLVFACRGEAEFKYKYSELLNWARGTGRDLSRFEMAGEWKRSLEKLINRIRKEIAAGNDPITCVKSVK